MCTTSQDRYVQCSTQYVIELYTGSTYDLLGSTRHIWGRVVRFTFTVDSHHYHSVLTRHSTAGGIRRLHTEHTYSTVSVASVLALPLTTC
jgi:hypothetical protein